MWNLKTSKGFALIEVMISLSLFAMLFSAALSIMISELKLEKCNSESCKSLAYLEGLKEVGANNFSYDDVLYLKNQNKLYVSSGKMEYDLLEGSEVKAIFTDLKPNSYPYIAINIKGESVLTVTMELHSLICNREDVFSTCFYKGMYKR